MWLENCESSSDISQFVCLWCMESKLWLKYINRLLILSLYTDHCDPLKIFEGRFADLCDAIEVDPVRIVNRLSSTELMASNVRKDISSMNGSLY